MSNEPVSTRTGHDRSPGRTRLAGLVLVLGMALLAACGGGDGRSPTPTPSSTPTSSGPTSTEASRPATTSKGETPAKPTPAEPGASSLGNGTHPVYLTGVNTSRRTITVDVVQLLDRNSAEAAKVCPELAGGDGEGYCIKNANAQLRTVGVPSSASIRVLNGSGLRKVDLAGLASARRPQKEDSFFEVTVSGGRVTSVKELYRA